MAVTLTCSVLRQSRLPICYGGGRSTSAGPCDQADLSATLPNAAWLSVPERPHPREVSPVSRGVMSQPLSGRLPAGLRLLPPPLPAALAGHLTIPLAARRQQGNGLTTFRRGNKLGGAGRVSPPVVPHLRWRSSEPPDLTTCLLAQACQHLWLVLCDDVYRRFTWVDRATSSWAPTTLMLAVAVLARTFTTTP